MHAGKNGEREYVSVNVTVVNVLTLNVIRKSSDELK